MARRGRRGLLAYRVRPLGKREARRSLELIIDPGNKRKEEDHEAAPGAYGSVPERDQSTADITGQDNRLFSPRAWPESAAK